MFSAFKKVVEKESQFQGNNTETDKYFRKHSIKGTLIFWGIIIIAFILFMYFCCR